MMENKRWRVEIQIVEHDGRTRAVARTLSDLDHKLLEAAGGDIEQITHQPALDPTRKVF